MTYRRPPGGSYVDPNYHIFVVICVDSIDRMTEQQLQSVKAGCKLREQVGSQPIYVHAWFMTRGVPDDMQERCEADSTAFEMRGSEFHYGGIVQNGGAALTKMVTIIHKYKFEGSEKNDEIYIVYYDVLRGELLDPGLLSRFKQMDSEDRSSDRDALCAGQHLHCKNRVVRKYLEIPQIVQYFDAGPHTANAYRTDGFEGLRRMVGGKIPA